MNRVAAYNYNFHTFTSSVPADGDFAKIGYQDITYILYPDKNGLFTFDTYEFSREIFRYTDYFNYQADLVDTNQSQVVTFKIEINNTDGSKESSELDVTFFNGACQRWECPLVEDGVVNLSELPMPYWEGYPFEYSIAAGDDVTRTLVDDGTGLGVDPNVRLIHKDCDGFYLKFHNSKWGYSYYLFERIAYENFSTKSLGDVREHCSWTDNYLDIGKEGQRKLDLFDYVQHEDRELMKALAKSNEVYLYTGNRYDLATSVSWLEVKIESMRVESTNKNNTFEQVVTVNLPKEKTRTRI